MVTVYGFGERLLNVMNMYLPRWFSIHRQSKVLRKYIDAAAGVVIDINIKSNQWNQEGSA
jgi:hypothetical protein